jgi:hypothetical protein
MRRMKWVLVAVAALIPVPFLPVTAQSSPSTPVEISGVVESFSHGTLDIKPAVRPAVWVMVPSDLHLDRGALKAGAQVSVKAYWSDLCYIATEVKIN